MNSYYFKIALLFLGLLQSTSVAADSIITLNRDRQSLFGNEVVTQPVLQVLAPKPKGVFVML